MILNTVGLNTSEPFKESNPLSGSAASATAGGAGQQDAMKDDQQGKDGVKKVKTAKERMQTQSVPMLTVREFLLQNYLVFINYFYLSPSVGLRIE